MAEYHGAVVDQAAGRAQDLDSTSLSVVAVFGVIIVFVAIFAFLTIEAERRSWLMPALFVAIFLLWPLYSILSR